MPIEGRKRMTLPRVGYNLAMILGGTFGMPLILFGVMLFEKRRKTFFRRLGFMGLPRIVSGGLKPIWVHALSVGEVMAAVPLIRALKGRLPDRPVVLSVSTFTGFQLATRRVKGIQKPVFFFPFDLIPSVKSVIRRIDPAAVLILETDLWPNFISCLKQRKTPLILVNARISPKSYNRYRRFRFATRMLFGALSGVCAPTAEDARRLMDLGVSESRIRVTGNLKYEQPVPATPSEIGCWKTALGFDGDPKILVAGSTHPGEEIFLLRAFVKIRKSYPKFRIVLAPRDPRRAEAVRRAAQAHGLGTILLSESRKEPSKGVVCIVVDRLGVLNRMYAAADMVFVGGSLVKEGGHNPLEPAAWGKPILFGPDMSDFAAIAGTLMAAGGAVRVKHADLLADEMLRLMRAPETARAMGDAARRAARKGKGAAEMVAEMVAHFLPEEPG